MGYTTSKQWEHRRDIGRDTSQQLRYNRDGSPTFNWPLGSSDPWNPQEAWQKCGQSTSYSWTSIRSIPKFPWFMHSDSFRFLAKVIFVNCLLIFFGRTRYGLSQTKKLSSPSVLLIWIQGQKVVLTQTKWVILWCEIKKTLVKGKHQDSSTFLKSRTTRVPFLEEPHHEALFENDFFLPNVAI